MIGALRILTNLIAGGAGFATGFQIGVRAGWLRQPRPMPHQLAATLENPLRLAYRNPGETLGLYGFRAGTTVLDLCCGSGLFTAEMARMVGPEGVVHAVDIQRPLLDLAEKRLFEAGLADRVRLHHRSATNLPLEDGSVDLAVIISALGELPDKVQALAEVKRVLKPDGRLAISDERLSPSYLSPGAVRRVAEAAGFRFGGKSGGGLSYHMIFLNSANHSEIV